MNEALLIECEKYINSGGSTLGTEYNVSVRRFKMMDIDTGLAELYLNENREKLFTDLLFSYIDRTGQKDSDIYKKAFIDRRLFSKIRSNKKYIPSKKTVLALCLALELSRADTEKLLSSAGYSLSYADDYDLVISFCIEKKIFNFFDINEALVHFGFEPF